MNFRTSGKPSSAPFRPLPLFAPLFLAACMGDIDSLETGDPAASAGAHEPGQGVMPAADNRTPEPGQQGTTGGDYDPVVRPPEAACKSPSTDGCLSRRLTRDEYDETIRDLLGDTSRPARFFSAELTNAGFTNDPSVQTVGSKLAEEYASAAEALGKRASDAIARIVPCNPTGEETCARVFVESFGKLAFRRPLHTDERDRYMALWRTGRQVDFANGVRLVVTALLQSPNFLYRVETGQAPKEGAAVARLTPWETATRISYLVWGTMPDAELFAAAGSGKLSSRDGVMAEVERMMASPRARLPITRFAREWFGFDGYGGIELPERLGTGIPDLMKTETGRLLDDLFREPGKRFSDLFTTGHSFANAKLASYYGWTGPKSAAFERVNLDPTRSAGILSQGGLMAMLGDSAPVFRGLFVRGKILCQDIPPPPEIPEDVLAAVVPKNDDALTEREQFEPMLEDPRCAGCHVLMNPIGFGFENFDAYGRWRATDKDKPVDPSGDIRGSDVPQPFSDLRGLVDRLRQSEQAADCLAESWFRFAYGRVPGQADACSLSTLRGRFKQSSYQIADLFAAAVETDAFWYRPAPGPGAGAIP